MSYKFFQNTACEYYPCHDLTELNCLFCFCPLYGKDCPGDYAILANGVKDCSSCVFPHQKENYEVIIKCLSGKSNKNLV